MTRSFGSRKDQDVLETSRTGTASLEQRFGLVTATAERWKRLGRQFQGYSRAHPQIEAKAAQNAASNSDSATGVSLRRLEFELFSAAFEPQLRGIADVESAWTTWN